MGQGNNKQTEDFLRLFSLKSPPPGLKDKILESALQTPRSSHGGTAFLLKGFVGCLFLLFIIIAVDAAITRAQNKLFSSIVQKGQDSTFLTEQERSLIQDIIGEFSNTSKSGANMNLYYLLEKKKKRGRQIEWRESLEKEMEQNESTKDPR